MENEQLEFASKFKRGDVVRLKSGGPAMTVEAVIEEGTVPDIRVIWFNEASGEVGCAHIPCHCLTLVPAAEDKESDRPTAPNGYELKLGKNIAEAPAGTLAWHYYTSTWVKAFIEACPGQELSPYAWYAIPKTP